MSPKWSCSLCTKNLATQQYQIEPTDIGRRFLSSVDGLFHLGIADRYFKCNSTDSGLWTHSLGAPEGSRFDLQLTKKFTKIILVFSRLLVSSITCR